MHIYQSPLRKVNTFPKVDIIQKLTYFVCIISIIEFRYFWPRWYILFRSKILPTKLLPQLVMKLPLTAVYVSSIHRN